MTRDLFTNAHTLAVDQHVQENGRILEYHTATTATTATGVENPAASGSTAPGTTAEITAARSQKTDGAKHGKAISHAHRKPILLLRRTRNPVPGKSRDHWSLRPIETRGFRTSGYQTSPYMPKMGAATLDTNERALGLAWHRKMSR